MSVPTQKNITRLLLDWSGGNEAALERLLPLVYDELRAIAQNQLRRERSIALWTRSQSTGSRARSSSDWPRK